MRAPANCLRGLRSKPLSPLWDIAVVGSGFGGSLLAMIARRLGHSVILLERGKHPRTVIGESSTPLANLLLEELAVRYNLPRIQPFAKYGTWQQTYSEIACGLKRGFTFYHHDLDHPRAGEPDREHQLLVAASPHDRIADTHWYRADVDSAFVREAQRLGVEYLDCVELQAANELSDRMRLSGTRHGAPVEYGARFVVDATGPRGFLYRAMRLTEAELPGMPKTEALWSHFTGVDRLQQDGWAADTPYPIDDAAVHHVFDGGWIWALRFNNGITSAGVAVSNGHRARWNLSEGAPAWNRLLASMPAVAKQFAHARASLPFTYLPKLSFRSGSMTGARWALLPSAAGFVDPLLSTGFPLTLLGTARLANLFETSWSDPATFTALLYDYAQQTDAEFLAAARLIGGLYAAMNNFPVFASLSLLYFAAASFSETARRLAKADLAPSFLLHSHPTFGPDCTAIVEQAKNVRSQADSHALNGAVLRAIAPFDVAGLSLAKRHNWYPVNAEDLLNASHLLGSSREDLLRVLHRSGFSEQSS